MDHKGFGLRRPRLFPMRSLLRLPSLAALLGGLLLFGPAHAGGTAVKCGRVYQDRPCAGFDGKLIAATKAQKTVSTNTAIDPSCKRRGAKAEQVISARASGVSEDDQLATTTSPAEKRLISEVYRAQGSAGQQRAAIEASCMSERARLARGDPGPGKP